MSTFSRYTNDTMRFKRYLFEGVALMLVVSAIQLILPQFIRTMLDDYIPNKKLHQAFLYFLVIVAAFFIRGLLVIRRNHQMLHFGYGFIYQLRMRIMRQLQLLSSRYYDRVPMGDIMTRMLDDIMNVENMTTNSVLNLVTDLVIIVGVLIMLFSMDWSLALAALAVMPFYTWNFRHFRGRLRQRNRDIQKNYSALSSEFSESISGIKIIKSFSLEEYKSRKLTHLFDKDLDMRVSTYTLNAVFQVISEFLTILGTALILFYGGYQVMHGKLSVGQVVAFYTYVGYLYNPLMQIAGMLQVIQRGLASIERIYELLDIAPWPHEKPNALDPRPVKGVLEFKDVAFSYDHAKEPSLNGISFSLTPGKTTALVGTSGAGKTTIINLILRFYDPTEGCVLLDGKDLRDLKVEGLRQALSTVLQEGFLFTGSVMDNIRMGRLEASDDEVVVAAREAGALGFIEAMPEGFKTLIGEQGMNLSGGQRQLIAIARALLRNAPLVLLDEPTSAMDSETEFQVRQSIERLSQNRATLIIAHRFSTVLRADEILVMKKGRILERGTHQQLLDIGGYYKRLYHLQFEHRVKKSEVQV
jgi:ATP-binding cassette, subfamily B, bacterial MsbA